MQISRLLFSRGWFIFAYFTEIYSPDQTERSKNYEISFQQKFFTINVDVIIACWINFMRDWKKIQLPRLCFILTTLTPIFLSQKKKRNSSVKFSETWHSSHLLYIGGTYVKLWFWVGIGTLAGGDFFQVGLENSLYKK